jgi:hypothetical protein
MPYIGQQITTAQPSYLIIDDISSSFNGTTTSFALQVNGSTPAPFPVAAQNCLISVGGVVQEPDSGGTNGFNLSGSNIVFSSAPSSGESFWGVVLAGADYVNVGAQFPDGSVSNPSITFSADDDTGFYRSASGVVSLASTLSNNFTLTLGGNRTLGNPTNATAGQSGSIFVIQDATGSRTLAYQGNWDFIGGSAPTLSTGANQIDRIDYIVQSATDIQAVFTANYS